MQTPTKLWAVKTAATLSIIYALVLVGIATVLLFELISGTGRLGQEHLDRLGALGVTRFSAMSVIAAMYLSFGAYRLLCYNQKGFIVVPLGIIFIIGCIGELIDLLGTATAASNAIGGLILIMIAIPVLLAQWGTQTRH